MTIEEKARAYDEALKQAKFYHGNCPSEPERKKLEKMFPVLHESDDERVRKWLIAQMSSIVNTEAVKELDKDGYEMATKAIAYLEKQKEVGIQWLKSDNVKNPDKPYIDKAGMFYTTDGRMCYASEIEKQKEQNHYWKPTETDVALFNKAVTTNKALTPAERAQLDIIRSKFGCCRAVNCSGIVQEEQKPILEVFGFKVGDKVRLKDGDGRTHIIKKFERIEGLHGPDFYHVEFEDNSARDGIYPGEEYPNGYYTQMEKFEEGRKPEEKPINWTELTWKDINELEGIINNVHYEFRNGIGQESFGKEVLERFRSTKGIEYLDEAEQKYWRENEPKSEVGDDETEVQKAYREGKNAGRKEVFDHPEYYGLQPRRMYDYETGERNPEWSEEDRNNLNRIAAILVEGSNVQNWWRTERLITKEEMRKLTDWLKSLKPSWKPSEEELRTLDIVISDYRHACTKDSDKKAEILKPLLERLRKL